MGFLFFLYEYRAPLSGPSGCRSSTKNFKKLKNPNFKSDKTYRNLSNGFSASLNEKSRWGPPRWVACSLDLGEGRGQGGGSPGYLRGQEGKRQEAGLLRGLEAEEKCIYYAFEYSQKTRTQNVIWLSFSIFWDFWANLNEQAEIHPLGY